LLFHGENRRSEQNWLRDHQPVEPVVHPLVFVLSGVAKAFSSLQAVVGIDGLRSVPITRLRRHLYLLDTGAPLRLIWHRRASHEKS
jgi:hypothetical protein